MSTANYQPGAERDADRDLAIVVDFDGTLTTVDVGDAVCEAFAPPAWRDVDEAWLRGELTLPEAQRRMWGMARGERAAFEAFARKAAVLRQGAKRFLEGAAARGARLVLASGGFDFYIRPLLAELPAFSSVHCNGARFEAGGIVPLFNDEGLGCDRCAVCKAAVCARARRQGAARVMFVGDGSSDRCVLGGCSTAFRLGKHDALAAVRGRGLAAACDQAGVAYQAFDSFDELGPA